MVSVGLEYVATKQGSVSVPPMGTTMEADVKFRKPVLIRRHFNVVRTVFVILARVAVVVIYLIMESSVNRPTDALRGMGSAEMVAHVTQRLGSVNVPTMILQFMEWHVRKGKIV